MHRRNSIAAEQRYNFGRRCKASNAGSQSKHPRVQSWTYKFVCLPKTEQARLPTTVKERNEIEVAGLGKKKLQFLTLHMDLRNSQRSYMMLIQNCRKGVVLNYLNVVKAPENLN